MLSEMVTYLDSFYQKMFSGNSVISQVLVIRLYKISFFAVAYDIINLSLSNLRDIPICFKEIRLLCTRWTKCLLCLCWTNCIRFCYRTSINSHNILCSSIGFLIFLPSFSIIDDYLRLLNTYRVYIRTLLYTCVYMYKCAPIKCYSRTCLLMCEVLMWNFLLIK